MILLSILLSWWSPESSSLNPEANHPLSSFSTEKIFSAGNMDASTTYLEPSRSEILFPEQMQLLWSVTSHSFKAWHLFYPLFFQRTLGRHHLALGLMLLSACQLSRQLCVAVDFIGWLKSSLCLADLSFLDESDIVNLPEGRKARVEALLPWRTL